MNNLNEILLSEIEAFRAIGNKFLSGEMSKMDFKGASGGMGVYAQSSGKDFMVRFRMPAGIASIKDLKQIYDFANRYKVENIHITTRQAMQLHGITIDEVCNIMKEGINKELYVRGSGGNYPRNVSASPLSGVEKNEVFDISPYATAVGKHFLNKIYTYKLPRKFKVAFSSNDKDESHVTATDLGFLAVIENGTQYFKVYLGGGIGNNSRLSVSSGQLINPEDILYHVEALTELFINEGDYVNKGKARIRYIKERMGDEEFINCYNNYLEKVKAKGNLKIKVETKVYDKTGIETFIKNPRLISQKQNGLYSVYVHPIGGQLKTEYLKLIIDKIDGMNKIEIRLTMSEGLYIRNLNGKEAQILLDLTEEMGGNTSLQYSTCCIGVPTCQMGILESQSTLKDILRYFKEKNFSKDILPSVHISGCTNSCSVHEIGTIGFRGKKKKIQDELTNVFELHIGGDLGIGKTKLSKIYGDIKQVDVPKFLFELASAIDNSNKEFTTWMEQNVDEFNEIVTKYIV
ncbi:nitrite/sulfite reductase [Clostridium estertheticum]|uniref:nitrite/sulfite reductase n=1 Tax=Clostridium estertheticum TaxID=238834 RepID=UPI001C6E1B06|nr:nitrite/sulfite reductase [Clostridium estertheticum]MBW9173519.1 nitrite/sulfite reductase [Clostridium estertheticum]WLC76235.1 nitrite/sulfite reductase [Clostridium estertheticum]